MEDTYPVRDLCEALDVSRAGFYSWRQREPSERDRADADLGAEINTLFARSRRTYGSPRPHRALRRAGHACGRHRVARLMRGCGLVGRVRGRRGRRTTDSHHEDPIAPNRLGQRETPVERPGEVWAADITYVPTNEGWLYLAGVLDLGSCRLVGWAMGESLDTSLPLDALLMALRQRRPRAGLLHHSDRGCQYASEAYREQLSAWQVTPSMSRRGNCYDNAAMENFWSTLKQELVHRTHFENRAQALLSARFQLHSSRFFHPLHLLMATLFVIHFLRGPGRSGRQRLTQTFVANPSFLPRLASCHAANGRRGTTRCLC